MKRLVSWFMAVCLIVGMASVAYAVPDRMTTYMLQGILTEKGVALKLGEDTRAGDITRQSLYRCVENDAIVPIDWWALDAFGAELKLNAQALCTTSVDAMTLCEFVAIDVENYDAQLGEEKAVFHFTNEYPVDLAFIAVVGALKDGVQEKLDKGETLDEKALYDWQALRAEPVVQGIRVYFTTDTLKMVNGKDAVLALLCEKHEGKYVEETIITPGTPSKTVGDITDIRIYAAGNKNYILKIIPHTQQALKAFDVLRKHIVEERLPAIDYFGAEVTQKAAELLPASVDALALELSEFATCIAYNYDYDHGEVIADATFPTSYQNGQNIVAVVGVFKDDSTVVWTAQKAETVNGNARITFTQNIMTRLEENPCVLLILAEAQ